VRLYARDASGAQFVIGGPDLAGAAHHAAVEGRTIPSAWLFTKVPLPPDQSLAKLVWRQQPARVASQSQLLGLRVRRVLSRERSAPGEIVALRGAARLHDPAKDSISIVSGLVEIAFHPARQEPGSVRTRLPILGAGDRGRLVVSDENEAVGLILGGSKHRAIVAPLDHFMREEGLELVNAAEFDERAPGVRNLERLEMGAHSLFEEFATGPRLSLGDLESAA
jgi:hypothetical protein